MKLSICSISKILTTLGMIMLVIAALGGYVGYTFLVDLNVDRNRQMARVQESEWFFVESIISENYDKAYMEAEGIKRDILVGIGKRYPNDRTELRNDLSNLSTDGKVFSVFSDSIRGRYLNGIHNDRNDPFIMSSRGMYTDLSLNRAMQLQGDTRVIKDWESEYKLHANPNLMRQAIAAFVERNGTPVFWEYTRSLDPNHISISAMDIKELRLVYYKEGIAGLRTYEFGKAAYIFEHEDLFGVPDGDSKGSFTNNDKVIVVSGFSLYDILTQKYSHTIARYDDMYTEIDIRYDYTRTAIVNTTVAAIGILFIGFFGVFYMQHLVVARNASKRVGGENASRDIH